MTSELLYTTTNLVDCHELDRFAENVYGRPFDCLTSGAYNADGYSQDTVVTTTISPQDLEPDEYRDAAMTKWRMAPVPGPEASYEERSAYEAAMPPVDYLLEDLYARGLIGHGEWAVRMWW